MEEIFPTPLSKTKIFSTPHNVIKKSTEIYDQNRLRSK